MSDLMMGQPMFTPNQQYPPPQQHLNYNPLIFPPMVMGQPLDGTGGSGGGGFNQNKQQNFRNSMDA
jgi:hypothetical protein